MDSHFKDLVEYLRYKIVKLLDGFIIGFFEVVKCKNRRYTRPRLKSVGGSCKQ